MDDRLPRYIFTSRSLIQAARLNRMDLFVALFPMTALLSAVMEEGLDRIHRIIMLCDAFLTVYLYHVAMFEYEHQAQQVRAISFKRNSGKPISI